MDVRFGMVSDRVVGVRFGMVLDRVVSVRLGCRCEIVAVDRSHQCHPQYWLCWFFFFFFNAALVDVGLCRWWLSVLLQ